VGGECGRAGEGRTTTLLLRFLTRACLCAFTEKEINRQGETLDLKKIKKIIDKIPLISV